MKKKTVSSILLIFLAFSLGGCGQQKQTNSIGTNLIEEVSYEKENTALAKTINYEELGFNPNEKSIYLEGIANQFKYCVVKLKDNSLEKQIIIKNKNTGKEAFVFETIIGKTAQQKLNEDKQRISLGKDEPDFCEKENDLDISAIKYIQSYRDYPDFVNDKDNYIIIPFCTNYYIDDGENCIKIWMDDQLFGNLSKEEQRKLLNSISIVENSENELMQSIEICEFIEKK